MTVMILKNAKVFLDCCDISGIANRIRYGMENRLQEASTIDDDVEKYVPGITKFTTEVDGYYDEDIDYCVENYTNPTLSIFTSTNPNAFGYSMEGVEEMATFNFPVGELKNYTIRFESKSRGVRVVTLDGEITKTSTYTGNGKELGAISSDQKLYSFAHVIDVSGTSPTLDITVESDADNSFSSPTTRITHTQFTDTGSEMKTADGPITDTWFRVKYTIGGGSPSFKMIVGLGIV